MKPSSLEGSREAGHETSNETALKNGNFEIKPHRQPIDHVGCFRSLWRWADCLRECPVEVEAHVRSWTISRRHTRTETIQNQRSRTLTKNHFCRGPFSAVSKPKVFPTLFSNWMPTFAPLHTQSLHNVHHVEKSRVKFPEFAKKNSCWIFAKIAHTSPIFSQDFVWIAWNSRKIVGGLRIFPNLQKKNQKFWEC